MSNVIIVTYDLVAPGRNYDKIIEKIQRYEGWARLADSSYLISTGHNAVDVRDDLLRVMDANDVLFVAPVGVPAAWWGLSNEVANWIHSEIL